MAETIFRYIDGVLRPIKVSNIKAGKQSVTTVNQHRQIPKQKLAPGHYRTPHAFTIPNATCQVCGAKVFYYEHPNGARVLFDQLGPPWPKHPCYEAGQAINRNVITQAATATGPHWVQEGWQPLFYEKHILLQSGEALRVQARTKRYQVIFEVPLATLRQRYIQIEQVCRLLMQAKEDAGKVLIQIHDGSRSFEITTKNSRQIEQAVPLQTATQLTETQFASLTKLDVAIQCKRDGKRWCVNLSRHGKNHTIDFKAKNFERLKPFIYRLEAWVSKPNKNGNQVVYLLETLNRHFISSVIPVDVFSASHPAVEKPVIPAAKANLDVQAERLEVVSVIPHLAGSKLVCGTLGDKQITIKVDDRLFLFGDTSEQITTGNTQVFLRQIKDPKESKADFALYIHKTGETISARPRGYVYLLSENVSDVWGKSSKTGGNVNNKTFEDTRNNHFLEKEINSEAGFLVGSKMSSVDLTSDVETVKLLNEIEVQSHGNNSLVSENELAEWIATYCAKLAGIEFSGGDIAVVKLVSEEQTFEFPLLKYSKQLRQLLLLLLERDEELTFLLQTDERGGFNIMCGEISFGRLRYLVKPLRSSRIDRVLYWAERNSTFL